MTDTPGTPLTTREFTRISRAFSEAGFDIGFHDDYGAFTGEVLAALEGAGLTIRERRERVDPDEAPHCVDCGVEVDGLGPPICEECADD